jgi:TPR repeat protein
MLHEDDDDACVEARRLVKRALKAADVSEHRDLLRQAYETLRPLIAGNVPCAQYLHACFTLSLETQDEATQERRHIELIREAANAGHAESQFALGQFYDKGGELGFDAEKSAYWFRLSAEQGYAYAQWVHGLNLLNGTGLPRNEALGLEFIRYAAEGKFEGAIQFMTDAYAKGRDGFPRDERVAEEWHQKLDDPDLIEF